MRVTGQALGIALSAAVVATRLPVYLAGAGGTPSAAQQSAALAAAIGDAFVVAAAVCCDRHRDEPHPRRRAAGDPGAGPERHPILTPA